LLINSGKNLTFGDTKTDHGEVTSETDIDVERAGLRVHATNEHDIVDFLLFFQVVTIENNSVINDLTDQTNR
jgi:hypothetical protein